LGRRVSALSSAKAKNGNLATYFYLFTWKQRGGAKAELKMYPPNPFLFKGNARLELFSCFEFFTQKFQKKFIIEIQKMYKLKV